MAILQGTACPADQFLENHEECKGTCETFIVNVENGDAEDASSYGGGVTIATASAAVTNYKSRCFNMDGMKPDLLEEGCISVDATEM